MKYLFLFLLLSTNVFSQEDVKAREENLNLAIGIDEIKKFDYKYNTQIQIGNESVLKLILAPSKQEITFRGMKAGKTSVTIRDAAGDTRDKFFVDVQADGNSNIVRELRELIGNIEGIEINIKGGKVVVEGELVVPNEIGKISSVLSKYPDVLVLVEYSKQTQTIIAREMQDAINKSGMKDVTVRVVNGYYWLEGVVNAEAKVELAKTIADAYLPDRIQSLGQSQGGARFQTQADKGTTRNFISWNENKDPEPPPKLVKISAQFVELSKEYSKVFSFKWQPFMSNDASISFGRSSEGGVSTEETGTLSGTISQLFPQLQSAKSAGYARVIQSGMVITNDKVGVNIVKSQTQDFAVGNGDTTIPKTAEIKFDLKTTPQIVAQESIFLKDLKIDVSLAKGFSASGSPLTTTNSVATNITVKSKESAAIGGIIQSSSITDYDKDPQQTSAGDGGDEGGGSTAQTSSLFNLFRGKSYGTAKSQFVMFVTPEILESATKGTDEIRKKFRKRER